MLKNINIYKTVLLILILIGNTINAENIQKIVYKNACNEDVHYNKDINTSKYIEYLYNKLDLTYAGTILGQEIKYSPKKIHLKDYFPNLSFPESSKTIIENKENKELRLEDNGTIFIFNIIELRDTSMIVRMTNKAKGGSYLVVSVLEINMSDDSMRELELCYAR